MTRTTSDTIRTARDPRQCAACLAQILPGERYRDEQLVTEGRTQPMPHHEECARCVDEVVYELYDFNANGVPYGCLAEIEDVDLPAWWIEWRDARTTEPMDTP